MENNNSEKQKEGKVDLYKYTIILDKISPEISITEIEETLNSSKFKFNKVEKIKPEMYTNFGIESKYKVSMNRISNHQSQDQ